MRSFTSRDEKHEGLLPVPSAAGDSTTPTQGCDARGDQGRPLYITKVRQSASGHVAYDPQDLKSHT